MQGEIVWLHGTTLDEVEKIHKATLLLALEETNRKYIEFAQQQEAIAARRREQDPCTRADTDRSHCG